LTTTNNQNKDDKIGELFGLSEKTVILIEMY